MPPDISRAQPLKLVIFDVDGVLTDGRIVIDDNGKESKFFNVRDGHGLKLMMRTGLRAAILTGRRSGVVEHRAADLGIDLVYQGAKVKMDIYEQILAEQNLTEEETAFVGDDLVDLPVMRRAGMALAPADAIEEVRAVSHFVSQYPGGHGAVREMVEFLLKARGTWNDVTARYF